MFGTRDQAIPFILFNPAPPPLVTLSQIPTTHTISSVERILDRRNNTSSARTLALATKLFPVCAPLCHRYPLEDTWVGFNEAREEAAQPGDARRAASTVGGTRTESWSYRTAQTATRRRCFGPTLRRMVVRECHVLKLLTNPALGRWQSCAGAGGGLPRTKQVKDDG